MGDLCHWLCAPHIHPTFPVCKCIYRSITGFVSHYHQHCTQSLNLFSSPLYLSIPEALAPHPTDNIYGLFLCLSGSGAARRLMGASSGMPASSSV